VKEIDYASSGVDIAEGERAVSLMKESVRKTFSSCVLSDLGHFGGLFRPDFSSYDDPVLVASTDGVGTKLKVAAMTGNYSTVGEDLVNHCVNDILVQGAMPLFFMDYIACGSLRAETVASIVTGLARGCSENGCSLLGGETAEMPGFYSPGDYDVAGTIVGVVDRASVIDGSGIRPGDLIIGLPSSGLHTNGYSLARKVLFEVAGLSPDDVHPFTGDMNVGRWLLKVHRSYLNAVKPLLGSGHLHGIAHITGGGIPGNLSRILPEGCGAEIRESWHVPPIFRLIQELGGIGSREMRRAFNMGAGMLLICPEARFEGTMDILSPHHPFEAGRILSGSGIKYLP